MPELPPADRHAPFKYGSLEDLRAHVKAIGSPLRFARSTQALTQPLSLGNRSFPNRILLQPMEGYDATEDGRPDELTLRRYERFARGGAGTVWMEACAICPEGKSNPHQLLLVDSNLDSFARMNEMIRSAAREEFGVAPVIILQLNHAGRYSNPSGVPTPVIARHDPLLDKARKIAPDSPVISDDEIEEIEGAWLHAARLARRAGFDGIDIKSCHGYIINELFAARTRKGRYGGSYENRTRLLTNVITRCLDAFGKEMFITLRLNVFDGHPYPYGWGVDKDDSNAPDLTEPARLLSELSRLGVRLVNVTLGNPYYGPHYTRPFSRAAAGASVPREHPLAGVGRFIRVTRELARAVPDMALVGTGYSWLKQYSAPAAAASIEDGHNALAGWGRMAFAYPDFARDILAKGEMDAAKTCAACSLCSELMRAGGPTGCPVRDKEVYGPILKKVRARGKT